MDRSRESMAPWKLATIALVALGGLFLLSSKQTAPSDTYVAPAVVVVETANEPVERVEQIEQWPDLIGTDATEAVNRIRSDRPDLAVIPVPAKSMVTADYVESRVRVYYDGQNRVTRIPRIG